MKFTKLQERFLINLGLETLIERNIPTTTKHKKVVEKEKTKRGWSDAQRAKFSKSMKKRWAKKRQAQA